MVMDNYGGVALNTYVPQPNQSGVNFGATHNQFRDTLPSNPIIEPELHDLANKSGRVDKNLYYTIYALNFTHGRNSDFNFIFRDTAAGKQLPPGFIVDQTILGTFVANTIARHTAGNGVSYRKREWQFESTQIGMSQEFSTELNDEDPVAANEVMAKYCYMMIEGIDNKKNMLKIDMICQMPTVMEAMSVVQANNDDIKTPHLIRQMRNDIMGSSNVGEFPSVIPGIKDRLSNFCTEELNACLVPSDAITAIQSRYSHINDKRVLVSNMMARLYQRPDRRATVVVNQLEVPGAGPAPRPIEVKEIPSLGVVFLKMPSNGHGIYKSTAAMPHGVTCYRKSVMCGRYVHMPMTSEIAQAMHEAKRAGKHVKTPYLGANDYETGDVFKVDIFRTMNSAADEWGIYTRDNTGVTAVQNLLTSTETARPNDLSFRNFILHYKNSMGGMNANQAAHLLLGLPMNGQNMQCPGLVTYISWVETQVYNAMINNYAGTILTQNWVKNCQSSELSSIHDNIVGYGHILVDLLKAYPAPGAAGGGGPFPPRPPFGGNPFVPPPGPRGPGYGGDDDDDNDDGQYFGGVASRSRSQSRARGRSVSRRSRGFSDRDPNTTSLPPASTRSQTPAVSRSLGTTGNVDIRVLNPDDAFQKIKELFYSNSVQSKKDAEDYFGDAVRFGTQAIPYTDKDPSGNIPYKVNVLGDIRVSGATHEDCEIMVEALNKRSDETRYGVVKEKLDALLETSGRYRFHYGLDQLESSNITESESANWFDIFEGCVNCIFPALFGAISGERSKRLADTLCYVKHVVTQLIRPDIIKATEELMEDGGNTKEALYFHLCIMRTVIAAILKDEVMIVSGMALSSPEIRTGCVAVHHLITYFGVLINTYDDVLGRKDVVFDKDTKVYDFLKPFGDMYNKFGMDDMFWVNSSTKIDWPLRGGEERDYSISKFSGGGMLDALADIVYETPGSNTDTDLRRVPCVCDPNFLDYTTCLNMLVESLHALQDEFKLKIGNAISFQTLPDLPEATSKYIQMVCCANSTSGKIAPKITIIQATVRLFQDVRMLLHLLKEGARVVNIAEIVKAYNRKLAVCYYIQRSTGYMHDVNASFLDIEGTYDGTSLEPKDVFSQEQANAFKLQPETNDDPAMNNFEIRENNIALFVSGNKIPFVSSTANLFEGYKENTGIGQAFSLPNVISTQVVSEATAESEVSTAAYNDGRTVDEDDLLGVNFGVVSEATAESEVSTAAYNDGRTVDEGDLLGVNFGVSGRFRAKKRYGLQSLQRRGSSRVQFSRGTKSTSGRYGTAAGGASSLFGNNTELQNSQVYRAFEQWRLGFAGPSYNLPLDLSMESLQDLWRDHGVPPPFCQDLFIVTSYATNSCVMASTSDAAPPACMFMSNYKIERNPNGRNFEKVALKVQLAPVVTNPYNLVVLPDAKVHSANFGSRINLARNAAEFVDTVSSGMTDLTKNTRTALVAKRCNAVVTLSLIGSSAAKYKTPFGECPRQYLKDYEFQGSLCSVPFLEAAGDFQNAANEAYNEETSGTVQGLPILNEGRVEFNRRHLHAPESYDLDCGYHLDLKNGSIVEIKDREGYTFLGHDTKPSSFRDTLNYLVVGDQAEKKLHVKLQ